jgi:hypothetical protein
MVLKQVKCPPKGNDKYSIPIFVNKWLPAMETYALDYVGIGDIIGTTKNNKADKVAIGYNKFVPIGGKCGAKSDDGCQGEQRHMYLKTYPLGYTPTCEDNDGNYTTTGKEDILGGTSLIGGMQEDLYNLNVKDTMAALVGRGPYASDDCMRIRLPVGNGLLKGNSRSIEEVRETGRGWYVEEKCVPRQPTNAKKYGEETFNIPYSASWCRQPIKEEFSSKGSNDANVNWIFMILLSVLFIVSTIVFTKRRKNVCSLLIFMYIFIIFLFLINHFSPMT